LKSGQFYRGKIDGIQKNFESPNIDQLLPAEKLCILADYTDIGEYPRFFKEERVLSKTVITEAENTDGRRGGITNHTVLYKWDRTVMHENASYVFDIDAFIEEILSGKRKFKMPPTPEYPSGVDFAIISLPPPIEWEVTP
jgi:hypothetical protein